MAKFARQLRRKDLAKFNEDRINKIVTKKSNAEDLDEKEKANRQLDLIRKGLKRKRGDYTPLKKKKKR